MHAIAIKKYFHYTLLQIYMHLTTVAYSSLCFDCNIKYHVAQSFSYFQNLGLEK